VVFKHRYSENKRFVKTVAQFTTLLPFEILGQMCERYIYIYRLKGELV